MPMPMGLATHDQVKRQIFVAPSPHFSWTLTCLLHRNPSKKFNQSPCSTVTVHKFAFTFTLLRQGTFHCIALSHWLIRYRQKHKCRQFWQFWQFFAQANNYPRNVCSSTGIDFLQTKQRPTGTTGTSKYAGGASILMSWCFAFAKYSRDWD